MKTLYLILPLLLLLCGCSNDTVDVDNATVAQDEEEVIQILPMNQGAILSDAELDKTIEAARNGDGKAAYRLFAHYGLGTGDTELAEQYAELAVELGYPTALYNKAVQMWDMYNNKFYKGPRIIKDDIKSLVERAIAAGHPDTRGLLDDLHEHEEASKESNSTTDSSEL